MMRLTLLTLVFAFPISGEVLRYTPDGDQVPYEAIFSRAFPPTSGGGAQVVFRSRNLFNNPTGKDGKSSNSIFVLGVQEAPDREVKPRKLGFDGFDHMSTTISANGRYLAGVGYNGSLTEPDKIKETVFLLDFHTGEMRTGITGSNKVIDISADGLILLYAGSLYGRTEALKHDFRTDRIVGLGSVENVSMSSDGRMVYSYRRYFGHTVVDFAISRILASVPPGVAPFDERNEISSAGNVVLNYKRMGGGASAVYVFDIANKKNVYIASTTAEKVGMDAYAQVLSLGNYLYDTRGSWPLNPVELPALDGKPDVRSSTLSASGKWVGLVACSVDGQCEGYVLANPL